MPIVNVPGVGQLQFPDGMSQQDMAAAIQKNFPQIHADARQPAAAPALQMSEGKAQGQRIASDLGQIASSPWQSLVDLGTKSLGETALNAVTGIGSSIAGGFRGLATLATGGSAQDAAKAVQDTQRDYTYQPRTAVGKLGSEALSLPLNIAKSASSSLGGDIGQAVNGDKGRIAGEAIGNALPDVAATLAGGAQALRAVRGAPTTAAPVADQPPPVNYDVPTYMRRGGAPIEDVPVKPVYTPSMLAEEMRAKAIQAAAPTEVPAASVAPEVPEIRTPIDAAPAIEPPAAAPVAPAGEITAALRDTSDIDGVLRQFGVEAPEAKAAPAPQEPAPSPSQAAATPAPPANPIDAKAAAQFSPAEQAPANPSAIDANTQALRDVGLEHIRESSVTGDAARAAREFQHGKITSEPAGQLWFDQFQRETEAMKNYAQRLVDDSGGRTGLDEASMTRKGMDIAAPYDAAREYFEKAKTALYNKADELAGGLPSVKLSKFGDLLDTDSMFEGRAEKSALRNGIRAYMSPKEQGITDKAGSMQEITAGQAEGLRKYLNGEWSPQNAGLIGRLKSALDEDVYDGAGAGSDVYAAGRAMHQLEKQTLDNPNGIAKLMDSDPYTPINRNTPYEKIPDKIMSLSEDQFKHIIDTYRNLPPELQPMAQQAIATLKAHYAERLLNSATETGRGNPRQLWDSGGVKKFTADNSAKLPLVFDEAELARIRKLLDAGEILRVNPAYPGAAAQLANASKAGMASHLIGRLGGGAGGVVGAIAGGPVGAGIGGVIGEAATSRLLHSAAERRALAEAQSGIISNFEPAPPLNPIDAWEQQARKK